MNDTVRWRAIPGYEGIYEVSDSGAVRSLTRRIQCSNRVIMRKGVQLRTNIDSGGYAQVCLCNRTRRRTVAVHQLVLEAFVGACPPGLEACHGNGVRTDNRLRNLRWGTRSENTLDKIRHGTHNWLTPAGRIVGNPRGISASKAA